MMPLDEAEQQLVGDSFRHRLYRKRQYVLQEGDVCATLNFVVRGCLRLYKIDDAGNVHIGPIPYKPSTAFNFTYPALLTGIWAPDCKIQR